MRRAAAALVALAVAAATGCGGGDADKQQEGLAWDGTPNVFRSKNLPNDRVVIAQVKNTGAETLHIVAADVEVRDASGHVLKGSAGFNTTYAHGLFGALQQPDPVPPAELLRLGKVVYLPKGASVPFFAAWRLPKGTPDREVTVDYGSGTLTVPVATGTTR